MYRAFPAGCVQHRFYSSKGAKLGGHMKMTFLNYSVIFNTDSNKIEVTGHFITVAIATLNELGGGTNR